MTTARDVIIVAGVWTVAGLGLALVVGRMIHHADQLAEQEAERHARIRTGDRCRRCGTRRTPLWLLDGGWHCTTHAHDVMQRSCWDLWFTHPAHAEHFYRAAVRILDQDPRPGPWDGNPERFAGWLAGHPELEEAS